MATTDFAVLQKELKRRSMKIALVAFDLLYLNGQDLRRLPLTARKAELKKIIAGSDIQFSKSFTVSGREIFAHACRVGLEGVVSKVADSSYISGRSRDWVKVTCAQRETLRMAGFALDGEKWTGCMSAGRKARILSMRARSTMASTRLRRPKLRRRLTPLIRKTQPYARRIAHRGVLRRNFGRD
jgi:bifunctional non-homologous end joining protein LigD